MRRESRGESFGVPVLGCLRQTTFFLSRKSDWRLGGDVVVVRLREGDNDVVHNQLLRCTTVLLLTKNSHTADLKKRSTAVWELLWPKIYRADIHVGYDGTW